MSLRRCLVAAIAVAPLLSPAGAAAQQFDLGEREYMNSCAQCHGREGGGDGPLAGYLSVEIPDLRTLQRDNDGVFPFRRLYEVIDGRAEVAGHGTGEMPAWGRRYDAEAPEWLGEMFAPADREAFVRGRILALIEHVSAFQEE
jgi:hypothetical protein